MSERVKVKVLLLFGNDAEIVADAPLEDRGEPARYPAAEVAAAVGLTPDELPGRSLTAVVGRDDRLSGWRLA
ncbi:hypothetical protein ACFY78_36735 [Streptomyces olindensis]|uniref:hypothetical protein n=1 Tax=Streptomyces olindensis TaxID=358823 RepID=UPI0036D076D7